MSTNIKKWTERLTDGQHNFASTNEARDAEIADLRAALQAQQGEAKAPAPAALTRYGWTEAYIGETSELVEDAKGTYVKFADVSALIAAPAPATLSADQIDQLWADTLTMTPMPRPAYTHFAKLLLVAAGSSQGQDAKDAVRYRFFRVSAAMCMNGLHSENLDAAIDAAMTAREGE